MTSDADARREALALGADAEGWIAAELARDGWSILARNWRGGGGELDVVALRDGRLRFVEVKCRVDGVGSLEEAIGPAKRRSLEAAADQWMVGNPQVAFTEVAFLVAWVTGSGAERGVAWIDDAFDEGD